MTLVEPGVAAEDVLTGLQLIALLEELHGSVEDGLEELTVPRRRSG